MALKKDVFNKYIQTRESNDLNDALARKRKYTHNKVFSLSEDEQNQSGNNAYSNASQTPVSDSSNASQTPVSDSSNASQTPVSDSSNASQTPVSDSSNASQTPVSDSSNASQTPVSDSSNASQTPVSDSSNASQTPVSDSSNASQTPVSDSSNASQTPVSDSSNASQTPVSDSSNASQTPVSDSSNASQTPVSDSSNASQTPVSDSSNASQKYNNIELDSLTGLQSDIVNFMLNNLESKPLRITVKLTTSMLIDALKSSKSMVEQGIYRLKRKGYIELYKRKNGRGGWCQYKLHKNLQIEKGNIQSVNQKEESFPIYNSNTTNTINKYSNDTKEQKITIPENDQLIDLIKKQNDQFQQQIAELQKQFLQQAPQTQPETKTVTVTESAETNNQETDNEDWADLDFSSLAEFGFTKRHVTQIKNFNKNLDVDNQLTVDSVQESIEHYAWALQNRLDEMASYAPANNRLRGLIGVLKKGGNWTEANYKSPEDLAFEASLIAKKERLEKVKVQKEEVFNLEFELWRESLTATEITNIEEKGELQGKMPPSAFKNKGDNKHYVAALKTYFKNNVYKG